MVDYYAVLEVDSKASQDEIKKAYLALVKKYHPDITQFDKKYSEEKIKLVNEAYSVLSDVSKRKDYDRKYSAEKYGETIINDTEEDVVIVRVFTLCHKYLDLIDNQIIRKNGFEKQNNERCNKLYNDFSASITTDYQYLVSHDLLHEDISDCLSGTFIMFSAFYTWGENFIKAEEILNMVSSFIERSSKLYPKFVEMKKNVSKNATYQRKIIKDTIQNTRRTSYYSDGGRQNYYEKNDSPGLLSLFWSSLGPRLKGQLIVLSFFGLICGYGWISDFFDGSKRYDNRPTSNVSSQYTKSSSSSNKTNKNDAVIPNFVDSSKLVKKDIPKIIEKPKTLTPIKNIKTGYVRGAPLLKNNGLCKLTIDNSQNQEAVYVRLWTVYPNKPVRAFNVAAGDSFTLENLSPDTYEIRYKFLYEEKDARVGSKSDSFNLTQVDTGYGVRYSASRITLYKVVSGNFHTNTIDVDDV